MGPVGVISIICTIGVFLLAGITLIGAANKRTPIELKLRRDKHYVPKMKIDPKAALHEPGICQCNDALAYHKGSGKCEVPGCPCQQFIPSDLDPQQLADIANTQVTRLAIENMNSRIDLETRTRALEVETESRRQRELGRR